MSQAWSYGKCWNFGKMIKQSFPKAWSEFIASNDWIEFKAKHTVSDNQVYYIKRGFLGKPLADDSVADGDELSNEIFPFGAHKGIKFSDLPQRYVMWLIQQPWIEKWPTVHLYAKRQSDWIKENAATKEDIKKLLTLD